MKNRIAAAAVGLLALSALLPVSAQTSRRAPTVSWWATTRVVPVPVYTSGDRLGTDALMLKGTGRTVLPMRDLFTTLGAIVDWDATNRTVYAWKTDGTGVRFTVGARAADLLIAPAVVAGTPTVSQTLTLDVPAMLINNRVYVPIRAASEALGTEVRWEGSKPAVYIGDEQPATADR